MHKKVAIFLPLTLTMVIGQTAFAQSDDSLSRQREALRVISEFADDFCKVVKSEGQTSAVEVEGATTAQLNGLLKKLGDLGISGSAKYSDSSWSGPLREDLRELSKQSGDCRLNIWKDLNGKMIEKIESRSRFSDDLAISSDTHVSYNVGKEDQKWNVVVFRVINNGIVNYKDVDIQMIPGEYPTHPIPERIDTSLFANRARCESVSMERESIWTMRCDYIAPHAVIGFAVRAAEKDGYPSGKISVASVDGSKEVGF